MEKVTAKSYTLRTGQDGWLGQVKAEIEAEKPTIAA